ncbi:MAG TPA: MBL fold metallo-hydrolase [Steroidobacteraceae bacterium]|nr:MBL fold metallo-hydrolase [Steroidobacteraceae bacterium]
MHLEFYGAAGEVTGSCHILEVQGRTLLLDCGLVQGGDDPDARNRAPFPFDVSCIDAVVLSHAHIDHCGRLPLLHRRGYRGPIHATAACRDLARILLADSAAMAEREADRARRHARERRHGRASGSGEPLFTIDDATATLRQFRTVRYAQPLEVLPGVTLTFRDAGHILGSASVWLDVEEQGVRRRLVFSGDVGQYDSPILRDPEADGAVDWVVMESTYGDRRHRERTETLRQFGQILREARRGGGNTLIPAFAVGRSQEILYALATHYDEWGVGDWQLFLDSPMAIEASAIYWRHAELYDDEAAAVRRRADRMPPLPNLVFSRSAEESMAINRIRDGAIVIAGSGMCTGGRIVHHLKHNLARPECNVIFTGFQAVGTLGRAIVDGRESVRIHGEPVTVAAKVHTLGGFSAHGDQEDLLRWHGGLHGPRRTYLVHGEHEGAEGLRAALHGRGVAAEIARAGQRVDLAVAA